MNTGNIVRDKSYAFAKHVVLFCKKILLEKNREYILSKQLLRAGTSIGANVAEAISASSKKDFIYKISIALKEAHETWYWLCLIRDTNGATNEDIGALFTENDELIALLTAIHKSSRKTLLYSSQ